MRARNICLAICAVAWLLGFVDFGGGSGPSSADAWNRYRRGRRGGYYNSAYAAQRRAVAYNVAIARQMLDAAEREYASAQNVASTAASGLESGRGALESAKSDVKDSSEAVHARQASIVANHQDEKFLELQRRFEQSQQQVRAATHRLLSSSEYRARLEAAQKVAEPSQAVPAVHKQVLEEDDQYQQALAVMQETRPQYEQQRYALYHNDAEWTDMVKQSKAAQSEQTKLSQKLNNVAANKITADHRMRRAAQTAAQARTIIAQGEALLGIRRSRTPTQTSYRR